VLTKFGKDEKEHKNSFGEDLNPLRPLKAIVIATQVIEQAWTWILTC